MNLTKGQRSPLSNFAKAGNQFDAHVSASGSGMTIDFACFGLTAAGKLVSDDYMTFYGQVASPCQGVAFTSENGGAKFGFDLDRLPTSVDKLTLTAAVDGQGKMSGLTAGSIRLVQGGQEVAVFNFTGADFADERALMLAEIYRKDGAWRFCPVAQGFNGGLDALVRHFGADVAEATASTPVSAPAPAPAPAPAAPGTIDLTKRINLEKRMAAEAPQLLDLTKTANISLEKVGLQMHKARFCAVFDISASMEDLYDAGEVQAFAERALAMGCRFDDDGEMDIFLFGARVHRVMTMNIGNYKVHLHTVLRQHPLEVDTQYGLTVRAIRQFYFPENGGSEEPRKTQADTPVYVVFQTDGDTGNKELTRRQIRASSYEPIFWQFVGLGPGRKFDFLDELDDLKGRLLDNTGFFPVKQLSGISDAVFYDKMVNEYSKWVTQAKQKGLLT